MTARQPERAARDSRSVAEHAPEGTVARVDRYFLSVEPSDRDPAESTDSAMLYAKRGDHYRDRLRRGHGARRPR
jgi:hypothetical protein